MKLLELHNVAGADDAALVLTTDSSIVTRGLPVFPPEISTRWRCDISVGYRVSRLGKGISRRFASRYYDAVTLLARIVPLDLCADGCIARADARAWAFDGSVAQGKWAELAAVESVKLLAGSHEVAIDMPCIDIDGAFEQVSRTMTLKNGDIVVASPGLLSVEFTEPPLHIEASLNGSTLLRFNIK